MFRQPFWMRHFGGDSPKRTLLWSNSAAIRFFNLGSLAKDCLRITCGIHYYIFIVGVDIYIYVVNTFCTFDEIVFGVTAMEDVRAGSRKLVNTYIDKNGKKKCVGIKNALKHSQRRAYAYTQNLVW